MIERLDGLRDLGWKAITSQVGQTVAPVRWARDAARFVNDLVGRPLAPADDLAATRVRDADYARRFVEAEAKRVSDRLRDEEAARAGRGEPAPVDVYRMDNSTRDLARIESVLKGRDIQFKVIDVEHDEASRSWATTRAKAHEFPMVFIAGEPVGGFDAMVQLDASGDLMKRVFPG